MGSAVGNVLSIPSYAVGGLLNEIQQGTFNPVRGVSQGLAQKQAVQTELPETLGIDPQSPLGLAVGIGGELLTPDPTDLFAFGRAAKGSGLFSHR